MRGAGAAGTTVVGAAGAAGAGATTEGAGVKSGIGGANPAPPPVPVGSCGFGNIGEGAVGATFCAAAGATPTPQAPTTSQARG